MRDRKIKKTISLGAFIAALTPPTPAIDTPTQKVCVNGDNCRFGAKCKFFHPISQSPTIPSNAKTRLCKFGLKCRNKALCSFAHTNEELIVLKCKFGIRCKKQDVCKFNHEPEKKIKVEEKKIEVEEFDLTKNKFPTINNNVEKIVKSTLNFKEKIEIEPECLNIKSDSRKTYLEGSIDEMIKAFMANQADDETFFMKLN